MSSFWIGFVLGALFVGVRRSLLRLLERAIDRSIDQIEAEERAKDEALERAAVDLNGKVHCQHGFGPCNCGCDQDQLPAAQPWEVSRDR